MTSPAPGESPLDYLVLPDGKTPASTLLNRPAPEPEPEPAPGPQPVPGWFGPVTAPPQARRVRPFPAISGFWSDLEECIQHLHQVAELSDFVIITFTEAPAGADPLGSCEMARQRVYINEVFLEEPAFYAFVLAHELGHALDPRYQFGAGAKYKTPGQPAHRIRSRNEFRRFPERILGAAAPEKAADLG